MIAERGIDKTREFFSKEMTRKDVSLGHALSISHRKRKAYPRTE